MFRHVLCVYPYRRELNKFKFCPPLGLEYIGTVISSYAQELDIIDLRKEAGRTYDFLRPETDMVCFSVNWNRDLKFLREEIRSVPPEIFTVLGGRHVTNDPEGWLADCTNVNAVVRGDGEEVIEDLCRGVPIESIDGFSYRKGDEIVHNPIRRLGNVREDLFPDRSLRRYSYEVEMDSIRTGVLFDTLSASRGCPFNCAFCSFNRNPWGEKRNWSGRSPEAIVEELAQIKAPLVAFTDEIFTHDMDRVGRICDLILSRGIRKKYIVNARLEVARRPDVLQKMEEAGFAALLLGIESAHDKTLHSMRKGFNTTMIRNYFEVLRERSMLLNGYFIFGNIGESKEEMMQIGPFAQELGVDTVVLSILRNNPYSGIDELVKQNPEYHIASSGKVYSDFCSLKELKTLRRTLYQQFYNKRQMMRILHKGYRCGLLNVLAQPLSNVTQFLYSLRKIWVGAHRS